VNNCSGNGNCVAANVCNCNSGFSSADCSAQTVTNQPNISINAKSVNATSSVIAGSLSITNSAVKLATQTTTTTIQGSLSMANSTISLISTITSGLSTLYVNGDLSLSSTEIDFSSSSGSVVVSNCINLTNAKISVNLTNANPATQKTLVLMKSSIGCVHDDGNTQFTFTNAPSCVGASGGDNTTSLFFVLSVLPNCPPSADGSRVSINNLVIIMAIISSILVFW